MMSLRFFGEWNLWVGLAVGLALAAAAVLLYRREEHRGGRWLGWVLSLLRALAILLAILMLTGPVLHHRTDLSERGRVRVFVDASRSMELDDAAMEQGRKLVFAQRVGWLPESAVDTKLVKAADAMTRARRAAAGASGASAEALAKVTETFAREVAAAYDHLSGANAPGVDPKKFKEEMSAKADAIARVKPDPAKTVTELVALAGAAARWETTLREAFSSYALGLANSPNAAIKTALQKFDGMSRWKRAEVLLTGGEETLLGRLAAKHRVELLALVGTEARLLWESKPEGGDAAPRSLAGQPEGAVTNLTEGIQARVGQRSQEREAVVLISDGQHNDGAVPAPVFKVFGSRGIPAYTVGFGASVPPEDMAVLRVKVPDSVFFKDRIKGEIQLKDDMPPGKPFTLKVEMDGQTLWEKKLITERSRLRTVPFDFPIQTLVEKKLLAKEKDVDVMSLPLAFRATASPVEGEREKRNNDREFHARAIMNRQKLLLLDGRARWEFRYLRNLFERDEQWEVNALLADKPGASGWERGTKLGTFPQDRETLMAYDLVIFGEIPRQMFKMEDLQLIRDFVEKRGGGFIVIDGKRAHVGTYADTPLGAVFPVDWKGEPIGDKKPSKLRLTERGAMVTAMNLDPDGAKNAALWQSLLPPHWVAPAKALPGAETLLEAMVGERSAPALVFRRFGSGRVLYAAFDESWRWRYEVADLHHQRFWNQMIRWIMEPPFAVKDARVSLDVGAVSYGPDESPTFRVRLRDPRGGPVETADAEIALYKDGARAASVKLTPDENGGGLFTAKSAPLKGGAYEVRVRWADLPDGESRARTQFAVRPQETGELGVLDCNEDLLRQLAAHAGGEYFREEEAADLVDRLEPLSRLRVVESSTVLWQSYAWFIPLIVLLTLEWVLRKRAGLL